MLRTFITACTILVLSLAFLAACNDDTDDSSELEDSPLGAAEEDDTGPIDNGAASPPDDLIVGDDGSTEVEDTLTPTTEERNGAVPEEVEDEFGDDVHEHASNGESAVPATESDPLEIVLSDFEIEMDSIVQAGNIFIEVTNDSEREHGIVIERIDITGDGNANDDDESASDEPLVELTVAPGETEQLEIELPAGEYNLYCPIDDHRELGMETQLTAE